MKQLLVVVTFLFVCSFDQLSLAQSAARITEKIDPTASIRIAHTRHPLLKSAKDMGRVDGSMRIDRMMLLLKPSEQQEQELNSLIASQQDMQSPKYHQWLTPSQYAARFGPSQSDVNQITGWLRQQGFTVNSVAQGKQWVEFSGNASQVESAFHTEMHHFLVNGEKHVANSTDISIPRALAPVLRGVLSLHDFRAKPLHGRNYEVRRDGLTGKLVPSTASSSKFGTYHTSQHGFHYLAPGDWAKIYNTSPLLQQGITGAGVSIAVVGADSDIHLSDVRTFRQIFNLPAKDPQIIVNGEYPGFFSPAEVESDLDVEWAGAIAPQATIKFVTSASTYSTAGFNLSLAYIVDNRIAPIMSVSIGACELFLGEQGNAFVYNAYRQAAAEGISIFSASGDTGAAGCDFQVGEPASFGPAVNATASTPYNVAVGGTMFSETDQESTYWNTNNRADNSSAIGYIPEAVWNETCDRDTDPDGCFGGFQDFLEASSGGPSSCSHSSDDQDGNRTCTGGYAKPSWQTGLGVPDDGARDLPDISFAAAGAHDGYLICVEGACQTSQSNGHTVIENAYVVGGTSAGAPSMSGLMALVEQSKGTYQGLINPTLYKLAAAENLANCNSSDLLDPNQPNSCVFRDITAGNNNVPGQIGYEAAAGYDLATGLGSINAAKLVERWNSVGKRATQTSLSIGKTLKLQHGQAVPMNALVRPLTGSGTPSGDFSLITDNGASLVGGSLDHGAFTGGVRGLPGGKYSLKAHYSGDSTFSSSESDPVKVSIAPENSNITVEPIDINILFGGRSFPEPVDGSVQYGQQVGLNITVHGNSGIGSPGGSVMVKIDGGSSIGPFALNEAGNVFVWLDHVGPHGLQPGNHHFVVSYAGDASFSPSTSNRVSILVDKAGVKYVMNPVPQLDQYPEGSLISLPLGFFTFEGSFHGKEQPTGTVRLYDCNLWDDLGSCAGFAPITGSVTLTQDGPQGPGLAQAIFKVTLPVGNHELTISYSGDANYFPIEGNETSPFAVQLTVAPKTSVAATVALTQSRATVNMGDVVDYRVSVKKSRSGDPSPTGSVLLLDVTGGPITDAIDLVNGYASLTLPWNHAGTQVLTAVYFGDTNYGPAYSATIQTMVAQGHTSAVLSAAVSNPSGQAQTSFTVVVSDNNANPNVDSPGTENGLVEFWDSLDGHAPQLLQTRPLTVGNGNTSITVLPTTLPVGHNQITAKFLGTPDWTPAVSNTVTVNVNSSPSGN